MSSSRMCSFIAGILNFVHLVDVYIIFFSITVVKIVRQIYNHCLSETENVFLNSLKCNWTAVS